LSFRRPQHRPVFRIVDPKIIYLLSGLEFGFQPARHFPSARPGLRRLRRISVLWENLRVRTPLALGALTRSAGCLQHPQPPLKLPLLCCDLAREDIAKFHMQGPKLLNGHPVEIVRRHFRVPCRCFRASRRIRGSAEADSSYRWTFRSAGIRAAQIAIAGHLKRAGRSLQR